MGDVPASHAKAPNLTYLSPVLVFSSSEESGSAVKGENPEGSVLLNVELPPNTESVRQSRR